MVSHIAHGSEKFFLTKDEIRPRRRLRSPVPAGQNMGGRGLGPGENRGRPDAGRCTPPFVIPPLRISSFFTQPLFLCQMRDFPRPSGTQALRNSGTGSRNTVSLGARSLPAENHLRASAGSYAHKGMHMTWMRKAPNGRKKPPKTDQKPAKNCKKLQNPR